MTTKIDYSQLDALFAEKIIAEMGGEMARQAISGLLRQGASKTQIVGRLRALLPTWEQTAERLAVVVDYLANGYEVEA